jgi:hypothetical protein
MLALTSQEIARYRSQLANSQEALAALDMIEDCEGDLEDAAISLAIQVGQTPDRSDWLGGLAKRCRSVICQAECQEKLLEGQLAEGLELLIQARICPPILATPVVLYVIQQGVAQFCEPLN